MEIISIAEFEARSAAAQAGRIDVILEAASSQADLFESNPNFTTLTYPSGNWSTNGDFWVERGDNHRF